MRVIVAGPVYVDPAQRDRFIEGHRALVERARSSPGCLDVSISPDSLEAGRVNLFEYWESRETLEAWRARAPRPSTDVAIDSVDVSKHDVARSGPPFD
ncbi:putative quinol monooxygenase [Glycomyces tarimensis]